MSSSPATKGSARDVRKDEKLFNATSKYKMKLFFTNTNNLFEKKKR